MDTIFALATAPGRSGLAVVRISGRDALRVGSTLYGEGVRSRKPVLRTLRDPRSGDVLDRVLILCFEQGASFTGEDVVEIHCHGSMAVVRAVLGCLGKCPELRPARAGEFTRRAFENSRLDLAQVEGLGDLIDAETEAQRRQALRIMQGELSGKVNIWRNRLVEISALLEVMIDFSEEDLPESLMIRIGSLLEELVSAFEHEIRGSKAAERIRDGFEVALVGAPNVGKSTLLNYLADRDVVMTSEIAGTTRDVIEVQLDLGGLAVTLLDTAGIRQSSDILEAEGIERTKSRAEAADLRVFLVDEEMDADLPLRIVDGDIVASAKADLIGTTGGLAVSGLTGHGVDDLLDRLTQTLSDRVGSASSLIRYRHRQALEKGLEALESCRRQVETGTGSIDMAAEDVRICLQAVDEVVGRVNVEGLLDVIFSRFCIGK